MIFVGFVLAIKRVSYRLRKLILNLLCIADVNTWQRLWSNTYTKISYILIKISVIFIDKFIVNSFHQTDSKITIFFFKHSLFQMLHYINKLKQYKFKIKIKGYLSLLMYVNIALFTHLEVNQSYEKCCYQILIHFAF